MTKTEGDRLGGSSRSSRLILLALALALLALALVAVPVADGAKREQHAHWAAEEIETVVAAGLMAESVETFRPDELLTWDELAAVVEAIRGKPIRVSDPARPVKLVQLDAWLVRALRMVGPVREVRQELVNAGLKPPRRAAPETIARMLHLRKNHKQPDESRELLPGDPVTRAEAAYSVARALSIERWERQGIRRLARALALPELTELQRQILARGVRLVGYPYVWAGSSTAQQAPLGNTVPGGFDCSGFIWHVYKSEPFVDAPGLGDVLVGRSSYAMSGEVGRDQRVTREAIEPGDVLFFGEHGPDSDPDEVGHMGLYLGGGWMVHSSRYGTTLIPLEGWYEDQFAWARRPLSEAGLI